jgi:ABC-type glutathione transport system ATPase component
VFAVPGIGRTALGAAKSQDLRLLQSAVLARLGHGAGDPKLLVLDEPVSALDRSLRAGVLNLLADLQERLGLGYLFICHDMAVVRHFSDRVVEMRDGRIVDER